MISQNFPRVQTFPTKLLKDSPHFRVYRNPEGAHIPLLQPEESGISKNKARAAEDKNRQLEELLLKNSDDVMQSMSSITEAVKDIPEGQEVKASLDLLAIQLQQRDKLYLNHQKKEVLQMQKENEKSLLSLSQKMADLDQSLSIKMELSQQEIKTEVGNTSYLVQHLIQHVQYLSQMIDDKKGEKKRARAKKARRALRKSKGKKKKAHEEQDEREQMIEESEPEEMQKSASEGEQINKEAEAMGEQKEGEQQAPSSSRKRKKKDKEGRKKKSKKVHS